MSARPHPSDNQDPVVAIEECCSVLPRPDPFSALHGQVGVIRNKHIITSPNVNWVPEIQMQTSAVQLRKDMRFGVDDYVLWPQWYLPEYPHLPAVPRRPLQLEDSPYQCMWYTPSTDPVDFTLVAARAEGCFPGFLHHHIIDELLPLKEGIKADAILYLERHPAMGAPDRTVLDIHGALNVVIHTWLILTDNAGAFEEKALELVEFQRAWLDLRAMLDYQAWKAPGQPSSNEVSLGTRPCVGCVTDSLGVAMSMYDMRIPVWLVRDKMTVLRGNVYIKYGTTSCQSPEFLHPAVVVEPNTFFQVIYAGTPRNAKHYLSQRRFSRTRAVTTHTTGSGQMVHRAIGHDELARKDAGSIVLKLSTMRSLGAPFPEASSSASASSSSSSSRGRDPATSVTSSNASLRGKQGPHHAFSAMRSTKGRDTPYRKGEKFVEKSAPGEPYSIPLWARAIDELDIRRMKTELPLPHLYSIPPSSHFTKSHRYVLFYSSWLHIRALWMSQIRSWSGTVPGLRPQTWRDILRFSLGGPGGEHTEVQGPNMLDIQAEFKKVKLEVSDDGRVITFENGQQLKATFDVYSGTPENHLVSWKGTPINIKAEGIPDHVKFELLWEVHELGFRCDLVRLDAVLSREDDDITERQDRLTRCWSATLDGFYDPMHIDWPVEKDVGLASAHPRERLPFTRSVYALCRTWDFFRMPLGVEQILVHGLANEVIERLELRLIRQLQQTFYDVFSRAMVPPRRLFFSE